MITEYKLLALCNGLTDGQTDGQGDSQTVSETGRLVVWQTDRVTCRLAVAKTNWQQDRQNKIRSSRLTAGQPRLTVGQTERKFVSSHFRNSRQTHTYVFRCHSDVCTLRRPKYYQERIMTFALIEKETDWNYAGGIYIQHTAGIYRMVKDGKRVRGGGERWGSRLYSPQG